MNGRFQWKYWADPMNCENLFHAKQSAFSLLLVKHYKLEWCVFFVCFFPFTKWLRVHLGLTRRVDYTDDSRVIYGLTLHQQSRDVSFNKTKWMQWCDHHAQHSAYSLGFEEHVLSTAKVCGTWNVWWSRIPVLSSNVILKEIFHTAVGISTYSVTSLITSVKHRYSRNWHLLWA